MAHHRHQHPRKKKIIFIHLDLGIGGAEQLILNLAASSQDAGHDVTIVTSRCSQRHCFSQVKKPNGRLCRNVRVWGKFLPANVLGVGTALCSSIRMLYLSFWTAKRYGPTADLIVLDILPTAIPFLTTWVHSGILYYCHFPDKLLTRDTVNGEPTNGQLERSSLRSWYRGTMDSIEEQTMSYADVLVVNSNFTKSQVQRVFASLADHEVRVLYPALDMEKFAQPVFDDKTPMGPIVSLNRFERKKNIKLVLRAYAMLLQRTKKAPPLVIAGGYDVRNVENVEYLQELKGLASELDISSSVRFRPSISDEERATLMQAALCIVYTPHLEHFGIVPLEAMYAGRPVIAVNSGGPMETIIHEKTGFLCDGTPSTFCDALLSLVKNYPELSTTMGKAGHEHVKAKFGLERFQKQWVQLVDDTIETGKTRRMNQRGGYMVWRSFYYLFDALLTFGGALLLTYALRLVGILEPKQNIIGKLKSLRADWDDAL